MVHRISRYINTDADPITSVRPGCMVILQCAISELYRHFCHMPKHSAGDLTCINNLNHSKKWHTMENEDPSLSSSESNLPWTIPPSKWHKLGISATDIWLGGSLDNNNIYVKYVDESTKGNRQGHLLLSHTEVTLMSYYMMFTHSIWALSYYGLIFLLKAEMHIDHLFTLFWYKLTIIWFTLFSPLLCIFLQVMSTTQSCPQ